MKVKLYKDFLQKFGNVKIIIAIAKDVKNEKEDIKIYELLDDVEALIKQVFVKEKLAKHEMISVARVLSYCSQEGKHYDSKVEYLTKKILDGKRIERKNKLVDLVNYLTLKHLLPISVADLDKIKGNIHIRLALGNEKFFSIEGDHVVKAHEPIYLDDYKVIFRKFDYKESKYVAVDENTKNVLFIIEYVDKVKDKVEELKEDLKNVMLDFFNVNVKFFEVSKNKPEVELS